VDECGRETKQTTAGAKLDKINGSIGLKVTGCCDKTMHWSLQSIEVCALSTKKKTASFAKYYNCRIVEDFDINFDFLSLNT